MSANELVPTPLPVAVYADGNGRDESGRGAGINLDCVAVAAMVLVGWFDVQGVISGPKDAAVLVAPDRPVGLVDLSDLDGVPIGGHEVKGEQPGGATLAGSQWLRSSCQRGNAKQALAHIAECGRHCIAYQTRSALVGRIVSRWMVRIDSSFAC